MATRTACSLAAAAPPFSRGVEDGRDGDWGGARDGRVRCLLPCWVLGFDLVGLLGGCERRWGW